MLMISQLTILKMIVSVLTDAASALSAKPAIAGVVPTSVVVAM